MTKSQELAIIDKAIAALPQDSYLRPWLIGIRPEIEALMRSDILPEISISETRTHCEMLRKEALQHAEATKKSAKEFADKIVANATADALAIRNRLAADLRKALNAIN